MAITGIIGDRGSGKTLLLTFMGRRAKRNGSRVMTNYGCTFRDEALDADRLVDMGADLQFCFIGVDEIHVLIDSRRSGSARNMMVSYFILQTRKRGVEFQYATQHESQVDVRLRRSTDMWVRCERLRDKNGKKTDFFHYRLYRQLGGPMVGEFILDGRVAYHDYDTTEAITDF